MSELPQGWQECALEDISSDISYGYTAKSNSINGDARMLRITDIQDNRVDWSLVPFCEISESDKDKYLLRKLDLVFARTGATVGKSFLIRDEAPNSVFASYLIRVRSVNNEMASYLSRFFDSQAYWRQITEFSAGIGQPNVNGSKLKSLRVPLAPLPEQKRIADKLDSVLARVDACRDRLDRIPVILKRFRQSVLAAATSGKLTADWRSGNPIENTWSSKNLGDYVENCDGKRVPISEILRAARHGDYSYYGASGVIDTIDSYTHDGKFLLIGEDGANLLTRSKPIAFIASGKIWVNNHAHVLQCRDGAPEEFLGYFINSIDLAPYVSGSAQPKLNQKNMNSIVVPVPPVDEQHEIVHRVEALFAIADRLEARYTAARAQVEKLTPATLAKAFRGELVPQDPSDEPATELLKRIAATRAASGDKPRRGRVAKD